MSSVITSKPEFAALSNRGRLGNFLQSWPDFFSYLESGYAGFVTIRSRTPGSPHFRAVVEPNRVEFNLAELYSEGASREDLYIQQIPDPRSERRIQFEATRGANGAFVQASDAGLNLYYECNTIEPLRDIRDRGFHVHGLRAARVLRDYLYEDSFETVQEIWHDYPTAIIEATEFSRPCGALNRHLIVWEVRDF